MKKILVMLNHGLEETEIKFLENLDFTPEYLTDEEKAIWSNAPLQGCKAAILSILENHPECADYICQGAFWAVAQVQQLVGLDHCWFGYSKRIATPDARQADGSVVKTNTFVFEGYYCYGDIVEM